MALDALKFDEWQKYSFWSPPGKALKDIDVPEALQGYQTYQTAGLIPGPIATPSLPSIDAALDPNVADGYIYFVAIPDGGGKHAFAKSYTAHQANLEEVRVLMARAGWPDPADFAAPPTAAQRLAWDEADRAARPDRLGRRARARFAASRCRRVLRRPPRAHALPHRLRARRRRGEGRRRLRTVPRLRR